MQHKKPSISKNFGEIHQGDIVPEMKRANSERFELKRLDQVFHSWFSCLPKGVADLPVFTVDHPIDFLYFHVYYKLGDRVYQAEHSLREYELENENYYTLFIGLTNGIFLYSEEKAKQLGVIEEAGTFKTLDPANMRSFPKLMQFGLDYLKTDKLLPSITYNVYTTSVTVFLQNFHDQRKTVTIAFLDRSERERKD